MEMVTFWAREYFTLLSQRPQQWTFHIWLFYSSFGVQMHSLYATYIHYLSNNLLYTTNNILDSQSVWKWLFSGPKRK